MGGKTGTSHQGPRGFVYLVAGAGLFGFGSEFPDVAEGLVRDVVTAAEHPTDVHIPGRNPVDFEEPCEVDDDLVAKLSALPSA